MRDQRRGYLIPTTFGDEVIFVKPFKAGEAQQKKRTLTVCAKTSIRRGQCFWVCRVESPGVYPASP
jgi:hypothetical protein